MTVLRIVPNIAHSSPGELRDFYENLLGLETVMDLQWVITLSSGSQTAAPQISIAAEGGSDTPVPDISIEVDNLDEVYDRAKQAGYEIAYELTTEPWGVKRFYVRDPAGALLNILSHS